MERGCTVRWHSVYNVGRSAVERRGRETVLLYKKEAAILSNYRDFLGSSSMFMPNSLGHLSVSVCRVSECLLIIIRSGDPIVCWFPYYCLFTGYHPYP